MKALRLLCAIVFAACPAFAAAKAAPTDAVTYQIDVAHSGRATLEGFTGRLAPLWTRNLGGAISYPVIADGYVYVTVAAGTATVLYALDPASGNTVWQAAIAGQNPVSSLAYDAGRIFVLNMSGLVEAFDAKNGTQRWSTQLPGEWFFPWPPIATAKMVFIGGQGDAGEIYALSEKNGHLTWQSGIVRDAGAPIAYGKLVAITGPCGEYYGFAARTGEWLWTDETLYSMGGGATPVFYRNHIYVRDACSGNTILTANSGKAKGTFSADVAPSFFTLNGTDDMVALSGGTLSATPAGSDTPIWTFTGNGKLSTAPLLVDSYVVEGSSSGELYILNQTDGSTIASYNVGAAIPAPQEGSQNQPLTGLGAADGVLIVPAGSQLVAFAPE
jgi:outer membrane protein assembly factor BamB